MQDEQPESKTIGVVGFHFTPDLQKVTLIKKDHPEWQKGKLNGLGGRMEQQDEGDPMKTMVREFEEESGIIVKNWDLFGIYTFPNYTLHVYYTTGAITPKTTTAEEVFQIDPKTLNAFANNLVDGVEDFVTHILEKLLAQ